MPFNPEAFRRLERDIKANIEKGLDRSAAKATELFVKNFSNESFFGQPWEPNRRGGHILVKSGRLRDSIRQLKRTKGMRRIGTRLGYASVHNYGKTINRTSSRGKRYQIPMPQRQFIGSHPILNKKLQYIILKSLKQRYH